MFLDENRNKTGDGLYHVKFAWNVLFFLIVYLTEKIYLTIREYIVSL